MNERLVDLLFLIVGTALVGWGSYEIYAPLAKVSVGGIIIGLFVLARNT